MSRLTVEGLVAGYGPQPVLRGLDLAVPQGALAAVLGPSGCGKTTLLRVLAGLHPLRAGRVALGDRVLSAPGVHVPPERRGIGLVPQEGALFPHLSVASNVGFGLSRAQRRQGRVDEVLELVGLAGYGKRMPAQLSGGQQQRVALARALAPRPGVVLMDEPFSSLDAALRAELRADVRAALRASGATALLVTHDQEEALGMADLVAVLRDGVVAQLGTPQQVYLEPADLDVALFVGEAVVFDGRPGHGAVDTPLGRLKVTAEDAAASAESELSRRGTVLVRPEQVRIDRTGREGVAAMVTDVLFHGHDATVLLRLGDGHHVRCRVQGPLPASRGDAVSVSVSGAARFFPAGDQPVTSAIASPS
ncbi:ABC-type spermidine/putrescine transport system, ATPase component [Saccharomonospora marina XMU15]|uniref:ABC-type quaternary amine transporter n=1 Tax=Saccharomonospora marina XMU15 TaxID=882083 RepID=H5X5J1_9PSEU|nr:ABC transporter ATP-binding protein [Saccharomonospora marina]EHR50063.1 ABC-type spermidine/putrescine transport system, ATPase component [Saccharomonospora marina XMU15]